MYSSPASSNYRRLLQKVLQTYIERLYLESHASGDLERVPRTTKCFGWISKREQETENPAKYLCFAHDRVMH